MLEYEKKISLSENEYLRIFHLIGKRKTNYRQVNYYFDSNDFKMNSQGITCRIREKDGKYKATIKAHKQTNRECSIEKTREVLNQYDDSLFSGMHLELQGELTTERTILFSDGRCEVALDKNTYLGITDYEMEVEYIPEYENCAMNLIYQYMSILYPIKPLLHIISRRVSKSKSERFFEQKQQLQNKETKL